MSGIGDRRFGSGDAGERRPLVTCRACEFAWHTSAMAEGLRLLGSCPRCGGELDFREAVAEESDDARLGRRIEPHLALGLPRPPRR